MQINLLDVFSSENTEKTVNKKIEIKQIKFGSDLVKVLDPISVELKLKKISEKEFMLNGSLNTCLDMVCNRCNQVVKYKLNADFSKDIKLEKAVDENDFIKGYNLDLEKLVVSEIYLNYPMKVLCKPACKGICKHCGQDLNKKTCDCFNDDLDPRLAGLKALFDDNFKEV